MAYVMRSPSYCEANPLQGKDIKRRRERKQLQAFWEPPEENANSRHITQRAAIYFAVGAVIIRDLSVGKHNAIANLCGAAK